MDANVHFTHHQHNMDASASSAAALTAACARASASAPATSAPATAPSNGKRKRSVQGCMCDENDVLVEELKRVKNKVRDPTSHLAANYTRAISSIMHHPAPIRSGNEAKQLKNIGNYLGNQIQAILNKQRLCMGSNGTDTAPPEPVSDVQRLRQQSNRATAAARKQAAAIAVAATSAQQATATAASIATRVVSETAHKDYAPAYKKRTRCRHDGCSHQPTCTRSQTHSLAWVCVCASRAVVRDPRTERVARND